VQLLALEEDVCYDAKYYQGDDFLNDLELHQVERTAIIDEADSIGGYKEAVLYACNHPREAYDGNQRPVGRNAGLVEFKVSVPCKRHKDVAANQ